MTTNTTPEKLVRFREACRALGMGDRTGYRHLTEGSFPIPVLKIGGIWKVRRSDLDRVLLGSQDPIAKGEALAREVLAEDDEPP